MRTLKAVILWLSHGKLPQAGSDTGENISVSLFYEYAPDGGQITGSRTKLFSDKSCGNVFRVKGFMKNEKEQWIELNATQKNLVISPIKMGQEVIIVIGEQLVEDAIRSCLEV